MDLKLKQREVQKLVVCCVLLVKTSPFISSYVLFLDNIHRMKVSHLGAAVYLSSVIYCSGYCAVLVIYCQNSTKIWCILRLTVTSIIWVKLFQY